eukprot:TRINITY_DN8169_c0_g1_i4.p1 TRINITY_DN8169_c0_g1~~TRINITY_DN8169_c0_g1_i4.p1  ORF type:complete len:1053 (-),score=232.79 TRINITY_DN8169_c0_g1_i4:155-3313(-)
MFRFYATSQEVQEESSEATHPGNVLRLLRERSGGARWFLSPLGTLTTTQREFSALHSMRALHPQMLEAILQPGPEMFPSYSSSNPPPLAARFTIPFMQHMEKTFNGPQLAAIKWAAAHTAAGFEQASQDAADREENRRGSSRKGKIKEPEKSSSSPSWPFTLVQGPPGTGKTHTVWGMLNCIHLVQYQHYLQSLLASLAPEVTAITAVASGTSGIAMGRNASVGFPVGEGGLDALLAKMEGSFTRSLPRLAPKPRMLVCAPSNAAVDELLTRVVERGFIDGEMRVYRPDVARVGTDACSKAAQAVSVERRTRVLLEMPHAEARHHLQQLRGKEKQLSVQVGALKGRLQAMANSGGKAGGPEGVAGPKAAVEAAKEQGEQIALLQQLAALVEELDKVVVESQRLWTSSCASGGSMPLEHARNELEASYAAEAEVVFTTLSSSGRRIFSRLQHGFDTVVIDEAAQAGELALLPPLALKAARCVLVGDPQQLPATVISKVATNMLYSRSLFERFQRARCPTLLLNLQFRMHPAIRDFPSRYFYENRLIDAPSVVEKPEEPWHTHPLLRPYLFFDVSRGQESHGSSSMSYQNRDEAVLAVKLFQLLQEISAQAGASGPVPVGIVTPYKQQLRLLQQEFAGLEVPLRHPGSLYCNTVDAFQGQERDVIIMSCVRASQKGGVGFVADVRRMNVAMTRAKRALWILGNGSSLRRSDAWAAVLEDAKRRNCWLPFPKWEALLGGPAAPDGRDRGQKRGRSPSPGSTGAESRGELQGCQPGESREGWGRRSSREGRDGARGDERGRALPVMAPSAPGVTRSSGGTEFPPPNGRLSMPPPLWRPGDSPRKPGASNADITGGAKGAQALVPSRAGDESGPLETPESQKFSSGVALAPPSLALQQGPSHTLSIQSVSAMADVGGSFVFQGGELVLGREQVSRATGRNDGAGAQGAQNVLEMGDKRLVGPISLRGKTEVKGQGDGARAPSPPAYLAVTVSSIRAPQPVMGSKGSAGPSNLSLLSGEVGGSVGPRLALSAAKQAEDDLSEEEEGSWHPPHSPTPPD